jgi:hypothetical protein
LEVVSESLIRFSLIILMRTFYERCTCGDLKNELNSFKSRLKATFHGCHLWVAHLSQG